MAVRDKKGQMLLGDYLRAYAATPILTEGNLPGGGRLFETCSRALDDEPEQMDFVELSDEERGALAIIAGLPLKETDE